MSIVKNRIYISGPMTGKPDLNRQEFLNKGVELAAEGFDVINPIFNGLPADASWSDHMRADIRMLMECDSIHMLPGWRSSKGARLEWWIAHELGMTIEGADL